MGHFPAILKESDDSKSTLHIGGILSFMKPLCHKLTEDEVDISGWISSRNWIPNEKFCRECAALYEKGFAWKPPSARE